MYGGLSIVSGITYGIRTCFEEGFKLFVPDLSLKSVETS